MIRIMTTALVCFTLSATAIASDCSGPEAPTLPDGSSATMEALVASKNAVTEFQAANSEYLNCLDAEISSAKSAISTASEESKAAEAKATYQTLLDAYNQAVSAEETLAQDFNSAIRAYKAANP